MTTPAMFEWKGPAPQVERPAPGKPARIASDRTRPTQRGAAHPGPVNPLMQVQFTEGTPETGFGFELIPVDPAPTAPEHPAPADVETPAAEEPDLVISHTSEAGTLLLGSSKGDGAYDALRAAGQRWKGFRNPAAAGVDPSTLYVPQSRDRAPKRWLINRAAEALREAGFTVAVEVDATPRAAEQVKADKVERLNDRAEALAAKAERHAAASDARAAASDAITDGIPFGQPILVGHHSERRHRRDLDRAHNHMHKAVEHHRTAEEVSRRADTAAKHAEYLAKGENPRAILRRIERTEAEQRKIQRSLDGYTRNHRNGRNEIYYTEVHKPAEGDHREQLLERMAHVEEQLRGDRAAVHVLDQRN